MGEKSLQCSHNTWNGHDNIANLSGHCSKISEIADGRRKWDGEYEITFRRSEVTMRSSLKNAA